MSSISSCKVMSGNTKQKIREIFSTAFILNCYSTNQIELYKTIFADKNIKLLMEDQEILTTVKYFMENNLNLTQASKNSFMHRNTMIYRFDKLENLTGLNVKIFDDAVIFDNMLKVYENLNASIC